MSEKTIIRDGETRVFAQLLDGNRGRMSGNDWVEKEQILVLSNLERTVGTDDLLEVAARAAEIAGFVDGEAHPDYPGIFLQGDRDFTAVNSHTVQVALNYSRRTVRLDPTYTGIRIDAVTVSERTNEDLNGNEIYTEWQRNADADAIQQIGTVEKWLPSLSLEFSKSGWDCPLATAQQILGYTNADTFQGSPAGYWLCMAFPANSPDSGRKWEWSIKFVWSSQQWQQKIYYVGENGKPPANWNAAYNAGKTVKAVQVYGRTNFGFLRLPNVKNT